jgi:hypothetical protein
MTPLPIITIIMSKAGITPEKAQDIRQSIWLIPRKPATLQLTLSTKPRLPITGLTLPQVYRN